MFPALRSGKIYTVAFPATLLFGDLIFATSASYAASNWIGPSNGRSGFLALANSAAWRTFSTEAPMPDSPVEYESIAT